MSAHRITKHPRVCGAVAALLALALLGACATADKVPPVAVRKTVESPGKKSVTVSDEQSGAAVVLEHEQQLVVSLPITATEARAWLLVDLKPGVLAASSPTFERALRNVNEGDAAGATVWHFRPEAAGTVALRFELRRPRSLEPAVQTVTYDITVR